MKEIEAVIQPFKLDEVREILEKSKIPRIAIFEVEGAGVQQGKLPNTTSFRSDLKTLRRKFHEAG